MLRNILLPDEYVAPFNLEEDAEYNSYIIDMGYRIRQSLLQYNKSLANAKNLNNRNENMAVLEDFLTKERESYHKQLKSIQEANETDKTSYISMIEKLKAELREYKTAHHDELNKYESKVKTMREMYETTFNGEISKLKAERDEANNKLKELISTHSCQINERDKMYNEKEKSYLQLLQSEKDHNRKLTEKVSETLEKNNRPITSTVIGSIGEEMIEQWLRELFNSADIVNKSQQTAKGDLHIKIGTKVFLLEIKNKTVITKSDIDKFIRDVTENRNIINGGLFISINTPAIPNKGDFSLEYIDDVPVIYLYVPDKQTLRVAMKTLLFLNSKTDNNALIMAINSIYGKIGALSSTSVTIDKALSDLRNATESNRREIRNMLQELETLFSDNPEIKFETSITRLEFTAAEIELLQAVSAKHKKPKMADYIEGLNCTLKYLQDRGGLAKIKSVLNSSTEYPVPPVQLRLL